MDKKEAIQIVIDYRARPHLWEAVKFHAAIKTITGNDRVLSPRAAQRVIKSFRKNSNREFYFIYSLAQLISNGVWTPPKSKIARGLANNAKLEYSAAEYSKAARYIGSRVYKK